jgi:aspartate beta-hydroxylase
MPLNLSRTLDRWRQELQALLVDWGDAPSDESLESALKGLGAGQYPHAHGRTLLAHLQGTRNVLRAWSQPFPIRAAGLFHSVYSTDIYRPKVLDLQQRSWLKSVIGPTAEQLVYLFCTVPRFAFFEGFLNSSSSLADGLTIISQKDGESQDLELTSAEIYGLILVHMANEAEQSCLPGGLPGAWLSRINTWAEPLRSARVEFPEIFSCFPASFSFEDELRLRDAYLNGIEIAASDLATAMTHFSSCSDIFPWVGEPFVMRAYLAMIEGDTAQAQQHSQRAIEVFDSWGTPWDKRLSHNEWKQTAQTFLSANEQQRLRQISTAIIREPRAFFNRVVSAPSAAIVTLPAAPVPSRISAETDNGAAPEKPARLDRYLTSFSEGSAAQSARYPDLPSRPWHDPGNFPIVAALEHDYEVIKKEIVRLTGDNFQPESERIARKGTWEVAFFYERGKINVQNCALCPTIATIVGQYETMRTVSGLIYVSRLKAGTHIAPHSGPTNLRVRCHLGISIPDGDCGLRVGNETASWSDGKCILFDDSYEHEAWNYTDQERIVLIVDLWHPGLTAHERQVLKSLQHYTFTYAQELNGYWDRNRKAKADAAIDYH